MTTSRKVEPAPDPRNPDHADLRRLLGELREAPKDHGPVTWLCTRPDFSKRFFPQSLYFDSETGVDGDRWREHPWLRLPSGKPDPRLQVAIMPARLLDLVWSSEGNLIHPGDTIAADINMTQTALPAGSRLAAGSVVLEVSDIPNDGCVKWKARYGQPAYDWVRHPGLRADRPRGMFCRILQSGYISLGDQLSRF